MNLYFENSRGIERIIGTPKDETEAIKMIHEFCERNDFKIPYTRFWIDEDGRKVYDVGSHNEFFKLKGDNLTL